MSIARDVARLDASEPGTSARGVRARGSACRQTLRSMVAGVVCTATVAAAVSVPPAAARSRRPAVSCEVSDFSLMLRLYLPLARDGSGAPADADMRGSLEIRHQKVPLERRLWTLDGKRPIQFWNRAGELKMMLAFGPPDDRILLVIDTRQRRGETQFVGEFRLLASEVNLTGRLACEGG